MTVSKTDDRVVEHILLIDDDETMTEVLRAVLGGPEGLGYHVTVAPNGLLGLNCMHGLMGEEKPDLVLLDLVMPDFDGWEFMVAKNSDALVRDIPVLIVTATALESEKVRSIQGAIAILQKPYELDQVLGEIVKVKPPIPRGSRVEKSSRARIVVS